MALLLLSIKLLSWLSLIYLFYTGIVLPIYRRTFHPLAKYPGSFLSSITGWNLWYHTTTGDRHLRDLAEHAKYGPIVRIAPNAISINSVAALKAIYADRKANIQKAAWYIIVDAPTGELSTLTEVDREKHGFRRRVLNQAFSPIAMKEAEIFVLEHVNKWIKELGPREGNETDWSEPKDMSHWATYLTYDIIGDLAFGQQFNTISHDAHRIAPHMIMLGTQKIYRIGYLPIVNLIKPFISPPLVKFIGRYVSDEADDDTNARRYLVPRLEEEKKFAADTEKNGVKDSAHETAPTDENLPKRRRDMLHYLIHARDPETNAGFNDRQLQADSGLLVTAGTDTSSTTLSATLFYLVKNPSILTKVITEIRDTFSSIEDIRSGPALNSLTYFRACIDEALRLSPPVPTLLPREVVGNGLWIEGSFIPPGTMVGVPTYCILHNELYYPDPFSFKPERWIVDPTVTDPAVFRSKESVSQAREAFCAFSLGSRGCVGRPLAYMELTVGLGRCLWKYDIREVKPTKEPAWKAKEKPAPFDHLRREEEYQLIDGFLSSREGPVIQFHNRDA